MTNFVSMFETPTLDVVEQCLYCRWKNTAMCPRERDFVGRSLRDEDRYTHREICHRYTLTNEERERRWKQVMNKLHENL